MFFHIIFPFMYSITRRPVSFTSILAIFLISSSSLSPKVTGERGCNRRVGLLPYFHSTRNGIAYLSVQIKVSCECELVLIKIRYWRSLPSNLLKDGFEEGGRMENNGWLTNSPRMWRQLPSFLLRLVENRESRRANGKVFHYSRVNSRGFPRIREHNGRSTLKWHTGRDLRLSKLRG